MRRTLVELPARMYAAGTRPVARRPRNARPPPSLSFAHIAAGRTDLLARYAGQRLALHDDIVPDASMRERAVQLRITAGADMCYLIDRLESSRPVLTTPEQASVLGSDGHGK